MAAIAVYQKGQNLTSVVLTQQVVAANGGLTDAIEPNIYDLTAVIEEVDLSLNTNLEEVSPVNAAIENYHAVIDTLSLRLNVLTVNDGNDPNELAKGFWSGSYYYKMVYVVGTATGSIETNTIYVIAEDLQTGVRGKGRQIATLTMRPISVTGFPTRGVT
jgi:hypothetical protein